MEPRARHSTFVWITVVAFTFINEGTVNIAAALTPAMTQPVAVRLLFDPPRPVAPDAFAGPSASRPAEPANASSGAPSIVQDEPGSTIFSYRGKTWALVYSALDIDTLSLKEDALSHPPSLVVSVTYREGYAAPNGAMLAAASGPLELPTIGNVVRLSSDLRTAEPVLVPANSVREPAAPKPPTFSDYVLRRLSEWMQQLLVAQPASPKASAPRAVMRSPFAPMPERSPIRITRPAAASNMMPPIRPAGWNDDIGSPILPPTPMRAQISQQARARAISRLIRRRMLQNVVLGGNGKSYEVAGMEENIGVASPGWRVAAGRLYPSAGSAYDPARNRPGISVVRGFFERFDPRMMEKVADGADDKTITYYAHIWRLLPPAESKILQIQRRTNKDPDEILDYTGNMPHSFQDRLPVYDITYEDGVVKHIPLCTPIVFDLGGRGIATAARKTFFDLAGSGRPVAMNDLGAGVGLLVFDPGMRGRPGANGLALFGDETSLAGDRPDGFADGFEALNAFVKKAVDERVLNPRVLARMRLDSDDLLRLEKAYGLGMKIGGMNGKVISLREAGVAGIALSGAVSRAAENFDGRGNGLSRRSGAAFIRSDGTTGEYADLWFRYDDVWRLPTPIPGAMLPALSRP